MPSRLFTVLFIALLLFPWYLQAQDDPNPAPNLQSIASGAYIIPMDFDKQSTAYSDPDEGVDFIGFNMRAYGLVYRILAAGYEVKWVIRAGKNRGDADFSANVEMIHPTEALPSTEDFHTSVFLVDAQELLSVNECTGATEAPLDDLITEFENDVVVYRLLEEKELDVRYELSSPPRLAVLTDGITLGGPHIDLYEWADMPFSLLSSEAFFEDYSCYTFISQPHISFLTNNYVPSLIDYLTTGGNFLAHCISIPSFENQGFFLTTNGIDGDTGDDNVNFSYQYFNSDMPIMQFEGEVLEGLEGALNSFELDGGDWLPTTYQGILNQWDETILCARDWNGAPAGGNVIYMSGHGISSNDFPHYYDEIGNNPPETSFTQVWNLKRAFLNAAFIPGGIGYACAGADVCICEGESVTLGCENLSTETEYEWTPDDFLSCTDCPNPLASPPETLTYTMTSSTGCVADQITVVVDGNVSVDLQGEFSLACSGAGTVDLPISITGNLPVSFDILLDGVYLENVVATEAEILFEASIAGTYTIDNVQAEECSNSPTGSAILADAPVFAVELGADEVLCEGTTTNLTILNIDANATYEWSTGQGGTSIEVDTEGIYWVDASLGDCVDRDSINISVLNPASDFALPEQSTLCEFESVILSVPAQPGHVYDWSTGESGNQILVDSPGIYWVDANWQGCIWRDSTEVVVQALLPPLDLGEDVTDCARQTIELDASTQGAFTYLWQDGSTGSGYTVRDFGSYAVTVSDNCSQRVDQFNFIQETAEQSSAVLVPNAFSPDGNGVNDLFSARIAPGFEVRNFEFLVFDRWGKKLFETTEDQRGWDGTLQGEKLEMGVYVWYCRCEISFCEEWTSLFLKGNTTLIR